MTVPKLPSLDATAWRDRLKEAIPKRPDGSPIIVWDQLPGFVQGLRGQRDITASHDVQLHDHKVDLDEHSGRLADLEDRMAAAEARPSAPFPAA